MGKKLLFLLIGFTAFAQSENMDSNPRNGLDWNARVRFFYLYPIAFGHNAHSETQTGFGGLVVNYTVVTKGAFQTGFGLERTIYQVTDKQYVGSFGNTGNADAYLFASYAFPILHKISLVPEIAGGYSMHYFGAIQDGRSANGYTLRVGLMADYRRYRSISINAGLVFAHNRYGVASIPELSDFYSEAEILQVRVGVTLHFTEIVAGKKRRNAVRRELKLERKNKINP
ncbi:hypothetical protein [Flavobacterium sp.]|uniref:hypothetical protein n=1 Tax=Flavobacterium sp. TaxID=239 RepID=UPI001218F408|nr:hypothetical protein [Flavobacterium sp.]RZJ70215.1 MAG: hypothetical protein EOO49_14615 [Flavobacterium sp.]